MFKTLLVVGTATGLALAAGAASAADCSAEIDELENTLASMDAGMGPTGSTPAESGELTGDVDELHPPTEVMNEAVEGEATSSADVLAQNQGAPTDTEAAAVGEFETAAGAAKASDALGQARQLNQAGDEAACLEQVSKAREYLGT